MNQHTRAIVLLLTMSGVYTNTSCTKSAQGPPNAIGTTGTVASPGATQNESAGAEPSVPVATLSVSALSGRVTGARTPIVGATVTLWAAGPGAPQQIAQARTDADGHFSMGSAHG